ncbi:udp-glycosyltransferase 74f2 [Nicotiana attenuata]|uniref:Udp-glycosyltransferase 74f2 n=1 Tax=Nicotiana attenuata TaxID=49451 RepID=A0A1J6JEK6_NICAT|nr:udp-glycosyltransferase 74f2 [Nicotiana attenuata]
MEDNMRVSYKAHSLVLPSPLVGHINPMLQFSKRLETKGIKFTLVTTPYILKTMKKSYGSIVIDTISDGYDDGGVAKAESNEVYLEKFKQVGSETLAKLIEKLERLGYKVGCLVYDAFLP